LADPVNLLEENAARRPTRADPADRAERPEAIGLRCGRSIPAGAFTDVARTMALRHQKWDVQVGDVSALAPFPLVLTRRAWRALESLAAALARETDAVERELVRRPDLHRHLGLAPPLARALRSGTPDAAPPAAGRVMRFDFHATADGWRVSEVNSDVPGGFTESSRFAELVAERCDEGESTGDAGRAWTDAIAAAIPHGGAVGLLSAPGWLEDTQVVAHLAARLRASGFVALLVSPHQLRWNAGRAHVAAGPGSIALDAIVRFYQAEWLVRLTCTDAWIPLFGGGRTPVSNPARAALTESKRLPLVWPELDAPTTTWRRLLPETRHPPAARGLWRGDWVLKPAFGNTGDGVALRESVPRLEWYSRVAAALARPGQWVAQRRFRSIPVESPRGPMHACIGVYVVDGVVAGAYGRLSPSRVVDYAAIDTAVLVER
jgi:glutathionylspermidine synthase